MRAATVTFAIFVSLAVCLQGQSARPAPADRTADEQEIRKLIAEINAAFVERNYEPLERLYLEKFVSIRGRPQYNYRAQLISMMKADARDLAAGKKLDFQTVSYESENPQIRFFGTTAIVNIEKKNVWRYKSDQCLTRYQTTEVWIKREDAWRVAAAHATTFQCDPAPVYPLHPAVAAIPSQTMPQGNPDLAVDVAVRGTIAQISDSASGSEKFFADGYISANVGGELSPERSPLITALQARLIGQSRLIRRDEALQIFGDTAVYMFRFKQKGRSGEPEVPIQASMVLVEMDGQWKAVASHFSKVITD